ncbi:MULTISPECIES: LuxR family transcriptional regulator [Actinoplanes]|uniref:helix-turn-helix transcriptional regulator n=1 Tax=Actinoplanes TaxID=1865 RepID=UPI0005F2837D|nr:MULTISPECIES: LuxR family transcriptional regulator [Actinoplanes]GLY08452.1 helix-turn-helix transcriptional regulator [Actinoplanes sp. NBRC 101535]
MRLVARQSESVELRRITEAGSRGDGAAVLLLGEAGIGKSALIEAAMGSVREWLVLRAGGTEFESDLPYAALHQLCAPVLERRHDLPDPQRLAVETVFGLGAGPAPSPLLVGLAVLGLLSVAARDQPVCCVLDDVQWMDQGSRNALSFIARRIGAERVVLLFAAREAASVPELGSLTHLTVGPLNNGEAHDLLRSMNLSGLDEVVLDRVLAEAAGNPLALLEFARYAGSMGLPGTDVRPGSTVVHALEDRFIRRFRQLPPEAQAIVVLASAEPLGDLGLLRRAAVIRGLRTSALERAEDEGLVVLGPRVHFRHPLVRSAVYRSVTPGLRRQAHAALAKATDMSIDPDRRAWHRANAVAESDEEVALELEQSADRAQRRGGLVAAAAFLERAGRLTPEPSGQARRLIEGARLRLRAGAPAEAGRLVDEVERRTLEAPERAAVRLLRALIDFHITRSPQAAAALADAAADLGTDQARETYLEAFASFMFNDNVPGRLRELAVRIREQAPRREPARPVDLLLDALVDQILLPVQDAVPAMIRAVAAVREQARTSTANPWWMELVCQLCLDLCDDESMTEIADRQVQLARGQGAFAILPQALRYQTIARTAVGRFDDAAACLGEARAIDEAAGTVSLAGAELLLTAWSGDADRYRGLGEMLRSRVGTFEFTAEYYATAVLRNGLGDYQAALDAALAAQHRQQQGSYIIWGTQLELVEAAARSGQPDQADLAVRWLAALARANPSPWAVGGDLSAQALVTTGPEAEKLYRGAVDQFARTELRAFYARSRLVYGEWLRRAGRRAEARVELRAAHELLSAIGARAFAERAARELLATGEHPRRAGADPLSSLTDQEVLIAGKVSAGATSKEVAATLFLSPRTIDAHLRNIYRKLNISSRRQLRELPLRPPTTPTT